MNVTLIPFFLAANIVVNDISEWEYGPEYTYNLTLSTNLYQDTTPKPAISGYDTITIRCRPKDSDILFCHMGNLTRAMSYNNYNEEHYPFEKKFEILFNETGVQSIKIEPSLDETVMNVIKVIANHFSVDTTEMCNNDMQQPVVQYMREENTVIANCITTYGIKRKTLGAHQIKKDRNFQLKVLPMPEVTIPETRVSISKIRRGCTDIIDMKRVLVEGVLEIARFSGGVVIDDGFQMFSILNGYLNSSDSDANIILFEEILEINLVSIEPADHELPSIFDGEILH